MTEITRVLHVLGGVGLGGAESRIMDLYRQMDRSEIQFDFLVHSAGERKPQFYDEEIRRLGGKIYVLPKFRVYNYFSYRKAVRSFFQEHHEFGVVQGHMTSTAGIYLPVAKKCGVPVTVAHSRNAGVDKGLKGIATRFFRRNLVQKADYCFACSRLAGEDVFGRQAVEQDKVRIIHNAIDAARFTYNEEKRAQMREQLGITGKLVLGHVGRFNYQKNHPYLIDLFARLCKERQDAVLLLLGEGPDRKGIEEKCRALGIAEQVRFLGNQRRPEDYYQAMDLFLLPSFFEGIPLTVIEALACGDRAVMTDLPGIREWLLEAVPGADVLFVEMPEMRNADEPVASGLPEFERRLAKALSLSVCKGETRRADVSGISWEGIAERVIGTVAG